MVTAAVSGSAAVAHAQIGMGQAAMAPAGGVVNRAMGAFQNLNQNGPGWLYYGINAADRGLGYNGSYMTLGGFVPYAEDDLGGFWAADLRGHLSEYGGFFSNVGFVRKQFLGGTLLGVGVYWDYDADQNQYPTAGMAGTNQFGQFGHTYQQVGVSGEWLTDFGNIRSNGYIPVGSTAYTIGSPNSPFYQNFVMCQNGLDAALTGIDLEVGAYIPGLADWAGMVSVGGYALGNARYNWNQGPLAGKDVVPWFGGVYTRLDMTFIENWDFSLQANNDSFFDWTGFARLTYRMGGSRRRNVPDQMEQPMMRNEHIVRAHQTPIVALNPDNGNQPWRVIHVDNSAPAGGTGTVEAPFNTLAAGDTAATNAWDIVFVNRGIGAYDTQSPTPGPMNTTFSFNAPNQSLVGNGASFFIPTVTCGLKDIATNKSGLLPVLTNPTGASVLISSTGAGAVVANLNIQESRTGIEMTGAVSTAATRPVLVSNVTIGRSSPPGAGLAKGVFLDAASGDIRFTDTKINNMNDIGFEALGGSANVTYQGSIINSSTTGGSSSQPLVKIDGTTSGTISLAYGNSTGTVANALTDTGGGGIVVENQVGGTVNLGNINLTNINSAAGAISLVNADGTVNIQKATIATSGSGAVGTAAGFGLAIQGASDGTFNIFDMSITDVRTAAVNIDTSAAADVLFDNLVINQTAAAPTGKGLMAKGLQEITLTGASNSITTQNATAIEFNSVQTVDAGTGPAPGISPFAKVSTQTGTAATAVVLTGAPSSGTLNLGTNFTVATGTSGTTSNVTNTTAGTGVTVVIP